jgi:putative tricarboxylic transport membrane protein
MKHTLLGAVFATAMALPAFAGDYMIMAPAAPGGGWDGTARAMQEVMQAEGISASVQVQNVPGAGGTVGLAQFAATSTSWSARS